MRMIRKHQLFEVLCLLWVATTTTVLASSYCANGCGKSLSVLLLQSNNHANLKRSKLSRLGPLHASNSLEDLPNDDLSLPIVQQQQPIAENLVTPSSPPKEDLAFSVKGIFEKVEEGLRPPPATVEAVSKKVDANLAIWKSSQESMKQTVDANLGSFKASQDALKSKLELDMPAAYSDLAGNIQSSVTSTSRALDSLTQQGAVTRQQTLESIQASSKSFQESVNAQFPVVSKQAGDSVTNLVKGIETTTTNVLTGSRDALASTGKGLADKAVEFYTTESVQQQQAKLVEFGERYSSHMESKYHLSAVIESLATGQWFVDFCQYLESRLQDFIDSHDIEKNAPVLLLVATFFWGTVQRREGVQLGKRASEVEIDNLRDRLQSTKEAAAKENDVNAAQIKDLKSQMGELQAQVESLTVAAQQVAQQLEQSNAAAAVAAPAVEVAPPEPEPEIVASEPEPEIEIIPEPEPVVPEPEPEPFYAATTKKTKKKKAAKKTTKRKVAKKKVTKVSPSDESIAEPEEELSAPVAKATKGVKGAKASTTTTTAKKTKKKLIKKKVLKKVKKVAKKKKSTPVMEDDDDKEPAVNGVNGAAVNGESTATATATATATKKSVKRTKKAAATDGDWTNLSQSTLKRKTVKELTSYLEKKGVEFTDDNGKTLKKDSLVGLVLTN